MAILQTPPPHLLRSPPPQLLRSPPLLRSRRMLSLSANGIKCSLNDESNAGGFQKHVFAGLCASMLFTSPGNMVFAAESSHHNNIFNLAITRKSGDILKIDGSDDGKTQMLMMRGMTAKDFDPSRYAGRWFEVASLKRGFAGQGQEDCHCTQGVYTYDPTTPSIQVDTFCVHGGPDGYITGIRGRVQCLSEEDVDKTETDLERQEMIKEKCYLRFPTLPFIPKEPYDVIATDYDNFALVSGAKDNSFIQIYSRTPDPGADFIDKYKSYLSSFGYDSNAIKNTPQDCEVMSSSQLSLMMSKSGMEEALTNQFPDLELKAPVEFNPLSNAFVTFRKLVELYFK